MYKKNKGFKYEEIAKKFLEDNNYQILEQNFTSKFGEIDLIAKKNGRLFFVEVKGRKNTDYGFPREAVTSSKIKKIISSAKYFLSINRLDDIPCQFDVIEIIKDDRTINLIENAFSL